MGEQTAQQEAKGGGGGEGIFVNEAVFRALLDLVFIFRFIQNENVLGISSGALSIRQQQSSRLDMATSYVTLKNYGV